MEASLDFKPAIYKRLQELVSIFNANGDLKPIEDLVQKVSLTEEHLRNKNDNNREDNAEYALQVRLEAIKAVFGSK